MKLTPLDIKKQEFKKSMRGFDPVEVEAFLEMVSEQMESLIREKKDMADEILKLKTQLRDYQTVERTLQDTLVSAQESIRTSKANSNREAEMVIREAELKAEKILEDAKLKLAEMKNELVVVKAQKDSFARRLRHLLESQLDLITVLEMDDLGFRKYESRKPASAKSRASHPDKVEFAAVDDSLQEDEPRRPSVEPSHATSQQSYQARPKMSGAEADINRSDAEPRAAKEKDSGYDFKWDQHQLDLDDARQNIDRAESESPLRQEPSSNIDWEEHRLKQDRGQEPPETKPEEQSAPKHEPPHGISWGRRSAEVKAEDDKPEPDKQKSSKISDKLII